MKPLLLGFAILAVAASPAAYRIDHIMVGVADLDRGVAELTKLTGVTPVHGGKHPRGTHNALIALGDGTYLELIAFQPGVTSVPGLPDFSRLQKPTPLGWAVSTDDMGALRRTLVRSGLPLNDPQPGSRIMPSGTTLHWQTANLQKEIAGGPFFIAWAPGTPHPSSTSPAGCKLVSFEVASPDAKRLRALVQALALKTRVVSGKAESMSLALDCPKGRVTLQP